jgi:hypothetical protein
MARLLFVLCGTHFEGFSRLSDRFDLSSPMETLGMARLMVSGMEGRNEVSVCFWVGAVHIHSGEILLGGIVMSARPRY